MAAGQAEGGVEGVEERAGQADGSSGVSEGVEGSQRGMEEISLSGESWALSIGIGLRSTGQVAGGGAVENGHIERRRRVKIGVERRSGNQDSLLEIGR